MPARVQDRMSASVVSILSRLLRSHRSTKRMIVMLSDALLCVAAVWIAFSLRLGEWIIWEDEIFAVAMVALSSWFIIAFFMGVYRAIFRFGGSGMMVDLVKACAAMTIPMIIVFMIYSVPGIPRTIGLLQPIIFLMLLVLIRVSARYLLLDVLAQQTYEGLSRNVLIYGAGSAGQQLAASMRHEPAIRIIGFLDDDRRLDGQTLDGIKVYYTTDISNLIESKNVTDILLALPNLSRSRRNGIFEKLERYAVHVMTLPSMAHIVDGTISFSDLQELKVEDLLGRDPVPPNDLLLSKTIAGKCVLVTGAGGSIGSELCRQIIAKNPAQLVLVEMTEYALYLVEKELRTSLIESGKNPDLVVAVLGNITDQSACAAIFGEYMPQTVFHAAAYKHVPLVEMNPIQGIGNNVLSTLNAASEARRVGVANFVLVSTDKAVRPTNIMGASKRVCEMILQAFAASGEGRTIFAMVRFGNVLGSSGSVVPHFEQQIRYGGPVTITHKEITRYFMTIPEAAQLVIQAGAMAKGGEVYVLDMGEAVKIYDLATTMIRLSGLTVRDENNPSGDIEVCEVGLRPGEKLYEELLIGENPAPTSHSRIMQASEAFVVMDKLIPQLDQLKMHMNSRQVQEVIKDIICLVPEYVPQGSAVLPSPERQIDFR